MTKASFKKNEECPLFGFDSSPAAVERMVDQDELEKVMCNSEAVREMSSFEHAPKSAQMARSD